MLYIILAALFYTGAIILGTTAARNADNAVISTIMNVVSAVIPLAVAIPAVIKNGLANQKLGIIYALLAGVAIALFTLALNKSYAVNKVAIVAPIVFGGAIFLSTILSYFIFKERIGTIQGIGLAILAVGLIFVIYARATGS